MLWKAVVSSKLLAKTSIVLFLNKCDLLEQKLLSGVKVKDFVHSYGDRPNDVTHATKCQLLLLALAAVADQGGVLDRLCPALPRYPAEALA